MKRKASNTPPAKSTTAKEKCPLKGGEVITFLYPALPFHGVTSSLEPHFGRVTAVRDLHDDLLTEIEIAENPLLLRSRFMITYVAPNGMTGAYYTDYMRHLQILRSGLMTSRPAKLWEIRPGQTRNLAASHRKELGAAAR